MSGFWAGKRVFLTGHTGFKGAWLVHMLDTLGADVTGYALAPESDRQLFSLTDLKDSAKGEFADLRDRDRLHTAMVDCDPEIVIHMGAQALVRRSYADPLTTYESNVTGTANLLDGLKPLKNCAVALVITSDKVYRNDGDGRRFKEDEPLGGKDPYSASKACAEILTASWRDSFGDDPVIATARAGNVIGGGDWAADRLIPDMVRALEKGETLQLRYPDAVRPWQHVLDVLIGYLTYIEALATNPEAMPRALNFGPYETKLPTVREVVEELAKGFSINGKAWELAPGEHLPEAPLLMLDASLADEKLGWRPRLGVDEALSWTADWYRRWRLGEDPMALAREQLDTILARK